MKLSPQIRFRYISLTFLLLLFVSYFFAFKKTIEQYKLNRELKNIVLFAQNIKDRIDELNEKLNNYILNSSSSAEISREDIVNSISTYCRANRLELVNIPPEHSATLDGFVVKTSFFTYEGTFVDALGLIYMIETQMTNFRVRNILFETNQRDSRNKLKLYTTISLQYIDNTL